jgi:hypothetical protein
MTTLTTGKASEFITFSRTSNATLTDSDGKIKWAPHNLLLASEQFDAASWTKLNSGSTTPTVTANAAAAPNSTITADQLALGAISSSNQLSLVYASLTTEAVQYTISVWLRTVSGTATVYLNGQGSAYGTPVACALTTSWQSFSVTFTGNAGTSFVLIGPDSRTGSGQPTSQAAATVYAWGASLTRSDLGGMKANTSAYPMYNPTTAKNLAGFTEDFSGTGWVRTGLLAYGSGSVANAVVAPNGLQTADLLVESTSTGYHSLYRSFTSVANTPYLWSAYVKPAGRTIVQIAAQATGNVHIVEFNLTGSGTATTRSGSGTAAITALSDGWYRVSTIATATGSGTAYWQVDLCSAANTNSYTGDGTSGIYLWGAQLSDSASLDTYVPNYGAAPTAAAYYGPRLDFDPVTLAAKGLLVEELRTNGLVYSNDFNQTAAWAKAASGSGVLPVVTSGFTDPNGGTTAWRIQLDAGSNGSGDYSFLRQGHGLAAPFARSIWAKSNTGSAQTVTFVAPSAFRKVTIPTTWTRIEQIEPGAGAAQFDISVGGTAATPATADILVWNAQAETGSFATSYIPVGSSTAGATRNADLASVSTQAFPYSATEGTLVANGSPLPSVANTNNVIAELGDGGATNIFEIYRVSGGTNGALYVASGGVVSTITVSNAFPANAASKMGGVYKANDFQAAANGTLGTPVTSGAVPTAASNLYIGKYGGLLTNQWNGHIRQITYLPRRISNTELQTRTS